MRHLADAAASCQSSSSTSNASTASVDTASSNASINTERVDMQSRSFIMKVQHLIERCLTFYLDEEECAKALCQHAGIDPIITRTVWKELEKANQDFFEQYYISERVVRNHSTDGPEQDHLYIENRSKILTLARESLENLQATN